MRRRIGWLGAAAVGLVILLAGCSGASALPVTGSTGRAAVQSVEVVRSLAQQGDVSLLVKGTFPDSCTQLVEPVVSRSGGVVAVILVQQPVPGQKDCQPGAQPFERQVSLGSSLAPGSYTVSVNGVQQVFTLAGAALSSATPVAKPTNAPAAAPTATQVEVQTAPTTEPQPTVAAPTPAAPAPTSQPQPTTQPPAGQPDQGSQPSACENKAAFYSDVSIPDGTVFDPGQKFTKTWRVLNAGTCAWQGYALVFQEGDELSPQNRVALSGTVAAGSTVDISIDMIAPDKPGSYYSDWLISSGDGSTFGLGAGKNGLLWTKIGVRTLVPVTGGEDSCAYQTDESAESQLLGMINQARGSRGLKALQLNTKISAAAREHSQDMACNNFVEHYGSDGSTWFGRIQAQGVRYHSASENIYAGNPQFGGTPQGAFDWWMNSQVHRDNILDPKSTQIGIGYIFYDGSNYKGYYTLDFIQP